MIRFVLDNDKPHVNSILIECLAFILNFTLIYGFLAPTILIMLETDDRILEQINHYTISNALGFFAGIACIILTLAIGKPILWFIINGCMVLIGMPLAWYCSRKM